MTLLRLTTIIVVIALTLILFVAPSALTAAPIAECGAPNPAVEAALADCKKLAKDAQPYARYFWTTTEKGDDRNNFLVVFCAQLNLLSRGGKLKWPTFVAPDLVRIDIRDYYWDENGILSVWEKTAQTDVVFHQQAIVESNNVVLDVYHPGGKDSKGKEYERGVYEQTFYKGDIVPSPAIWLKQEAIAALRKATYSESPILVAEWFFCQTARQRSIYNNDEPGTGYYDFLGIKDRETMFKIAVADPDKANEGFRTWRAAVLKSGVSKQNRQVFRHGAIGGFIWGTLDTFVAKDKGVLLRNLRNGEFAHNAEEWFFVLPCGLPGMALFDNKGKRQAVAPDKIGHDKSPLSLKSGSNDLAIHNPLSCIRCHGKFDMLRDVNDVVRKMFKEGGPLKLADYDYKVTLELESEYLRDMNKLLKKDRADYVDAIREVTTSKQNPEGWDCTRFAEEYAASWNRYAEYGVSLKTAARELGCTEEKLLQSIEAFTKQRGQGDNVLALWLVDKTETLDRMTWEQSYALAISLTLGIKPPEKKVPVKQKEATK